MTFAHGASFAELLDRLLHARHGGRHQGGQTDQSYMVLDRLFHDRLPELRPYLNPAHHSCNSPIILLRYFSNVMNIALDGRQHDLVLLLSCFPWRTPSGF